jgi:hypothetical protein
VSQQCSNWQFLPLDFLAYLAWASSSCNKDQVHDKIYSNDKIMDEPSARTITCSWYGMPLGWRRSTSL